MHWYLAKIVYRIVCGQGDHTPQFDEQLRLIHAEDLSQAFEQARAIGITEEDSFLNKRNQEVQWQFINVSELHKLSSLFNGMELDSKVTEAANARTYIELVNEKAARLQSGLHDPVTHPV